MINVGGTIFGQCIPVERLIQGFLRGTDERIKGVYLVLGVYQSRLGKTRLWGNGL